MKKVLIGGMFDLTHLGHIKILRKAKSFGDYLIVNVSSDERTKLKKGKTRPILPAKDRIEIIKELRCVDEVICLEGDDNYPFFKVANIIKPDIIIMDNNEHSKLLKEEEFCKKNNIELIKIDRIITESEMSTTKIINKIRKEI